MGVIQGYLKTSGGGASENRKSVFNHFRDHFSVFSRPGGGGGESLKTGRSENVSPDLIMRFHRTEKSWTVRCGENFPIDVTMHTELLATYIAVKRVHSSFHVNK